MLERLKQVLEDTRRTKTVSKLSDYNSPAWAYLQADKTGYDRAVLDVISILSDKEPNSDH